MTPTEARKMVEKLSFGLDPFIGRRLPSQDVCFEPEIQEALRIVLDHCTIESDDQRQERKKADKIVERELCSKERHLKYPNSGKLWDNNDVITLLNMYRNGYNVYQIAYTLKRTPSAIKDQLKKLNYTSHKRREVSVKTNGDL